MSKRNNRFQETLSRRFRRLLSGDPNGVPPWLGVVAGGDEPGYFVPTDAPWVVHADFGTLVGGIRALLMQALHPGSLAGVRDHSRYESDPLGRLSGTIRWLTVTTFGSKSAVAQEANRVNRMHSKVAGSYQTGSGAETSYRASDPDLLLWVHIAFMESFLVAHQMYSWRKIPNGEFDTGADNYVNQWSVSVQPLGLVNVPLSERELEDLVTKFYDSGTLKVSDDTKRIIGFIRNPPLPIAAKIVYRLLFEAAVVSLRKEFAELLELRQKPKW
ncbi:MAG: oxygenase MpaB family protein, partial [Actinomycetota bacterium]